MSVQAPSAGGRWRVYANGEPTPASLKAGMLIFNLPAGSDQTATWRVVSGR